MNAPPSFLSQLLRHPLYLRLYLAHVKKTWSVMQVRWWFSVVYQCLGAVLLKVILIGVWSWRWSGKTVWWCKFCFFYKVWYKFKYMIECNCWHERWMHHLLSYHNCFFILYIWDLIWPMWKKKTIFVIQVRWWILVLIQCLVAVLLKGGNCWQCC